MIFQLENLKAFTLMLHTAHTYICLTVTHVGEVGTESIDIKPCAITKTCINAKGHLGHKML